MQTEGLDLDEWEVVSWLSDLWAPKFTGWSRCRNKAFTQQALIYRMPPLYTIGKRGVQPSAVEVFCNALRFPVERAGEKTHTVTFDFRKIDAYIADPGVNILDVAGIREELEGHPNYFYYVEQLALGVMSVEEAKEACGDVLEVWEWDGLDVSAAGLGVPKEIGCAV